MLAAAAGGAQDRRGPERNSYANPSAVIAAEIALAQDIRARGEGAALIAAAAPDAVLFAPALVWAGAWLKGHPQPDTTLRRQPYAVWSSCDGSLVVSRGAWQRGAATGWFTTIWRREPKGGYKWVLNQSGALASAQPVPDMLTAMVADCPEWTQRGGGMQGKAKEPVKARDLPALDPMLRKASARDGSLAWEASVAADGAQKLTVTWKKDGAETELPSGGR